MKVSKLVTRALLGALTSGVIVILYAYFEEKSVQQAATELNFGWLFTGMMVTVLLLTIVELLEQRKNKRVLGLLTKKLIQVSNEQKSGHVIISPRSDLHDLGTAVNRVQNRALDLTKDYNRQKRGYFGLLEYVPIGVMVIDQDREIYLSNRYLNDIMERELELYHELYYTNLTEFDVVKLIEETYRTKEDQHAEVKLNFTAGPKLLDVSVVYIPVSLHHFFVMLLVNDITEQKQIERMQLDFVSNVSHELKTPVTSIIGFSETLKNGALDDPAAASKFVDIIHQQGQKLAELINDILSLSRLNSVMNVDNQILAIKEVVTECLQPFKIMAASRNITIINQVSPDLKLEVDGSKLRYILSNLLQNAIRYNKKDGQVIISAQINKNNWQLTVADTGIGLTNEQQRRIFERFYRAETSRSKEVDGTGLGLAIVKEYVDLLGGQIKVASQVHTGTTFTVTLPLISEND